MFSFTCAARHQLCIIIIIIFKKDINLFYLFVIVVFQSLLHVLKESHRSRTVFRKVGGFVYVMSVLVSMEGTLAEPTKSPWTTGMRL